MLKSNWIIIIIFILCGHTFAQDSTLVEKKEDVKKSKLLFAFDARRSYVLEDKVKFLGIKIGAEIKEKHKVGLGIYWLQEPVNFVGRIDKVEFPEATDTLLFNFSYSGLFYDHIWLRTKRWELTTPFHLGLGGIELKYIDTAGRVSPHPFIKGGSFVFGMGGSVQFKIWRWLALGTGGGYRMMLTREENIKKPLNAPYYQFQVKVLLGELFRMAFRRKTLEDW